MRWGRASRMCAGFGVAVLVLAGCVDDVEVQVGPLGVSGATLDDSALDEFPTPAYGGPIFSWTSLCYGLCAAPDPPGLPRLLVYADGSVVRAETVVQPGGDGMAEAPATIEVFGGSAEMADVVELVNAMADLGAVDGASVRTPCDASEGHEILDVDTPLAAGRVVTYLLDEPPVCSNNSSHDAEVALREALRRLDAAATQPYEPQTLRWVMLANAPQYPADVLPAWPGPDPATLEPDGAYGERCVVLTEADLAAIGDPRAIPGGQMGARHYTVGGSTWRIWLRPLMPHEGDCRAVRATILGLNERDVYVE